jgi:hypothetical protein
MLSSRFVKENDGDDPTFPAPPRRRSNLNARQALELRPFAPVEVA